jgi:hypothetical protein
MFHYRQVPLHYVNSSEKYTKVHALSKRLSKVWLNFSGANNTVWKNHQARFFPSSRSECYVAADTQFTAPVCYLTPTQAT